jgi:hypothetical protein
MRPIHLKKLKPAGAATPRRARRRREERTLADAIATDVAALVVDPAFAGTPTGAVLRELCELDAIEHAFHGGLVLTVAEVPSDFRGPRMPELAERIAVRWARAPGVIDAVALGEAAAESAGSRPQGSAPCSPSDGPRVHGATDPARRRVRRSGPCVRRGVLRAAGSRNPVGLGRPPLALPRNAASSAQPRLGCEIHATPVGLPNHRAQPARASVRP